jgi:hypothetical protein
VNLARTEDQLQALYAQGVDLVASPDILLQFPVPVGAGALTQFPDMNHLPKSAGEEASGDTLFNEETQ